MEHEERGVHVSTGDGIVAHVHGLTAFAAGEEGRLNELLVRINALAGAPWQEIVRTLTADIAQADYNQHPRLACVSVEDDRVAALVFGDTTLSITIGGAETILDGRDSSTWIDVALRGQVDRIHAGTQSESAVVGVLRDGVVPAGGFLLDTTGPMPASGRWSEVPSTVGTTAPAIAPATAPAPAPAPTTAPAPDPDPAEQEPDPVQPESVHPDPEPAGEQPVAQDTATNELSQQDSDAQETSTPPAARGMFARIEELGRKDTLALAQQESEQKSASAFDNALFPTSEASDTAEPNPAPDDASAAATLAPARPQLSGVLCPIGHLSAPTENTCRTCQASIAPDAGTVRGDRPILGTLTFDDGAVLNIDRPAVIGSNVPAGYTVDSEPATIVRLDDGVDGVSDVQLEVRLSGWAVEIVDMQSKNGTYTSLSGERQTRTKLRPGQQVALQHDMTIETGGRSFSFALGQPQE